MKLSLLMTAAAATLTGTAAAVSDQYSISNLITTTNPAHGESRGTNIITFQFHDWSVEPAETTSCTASFFHGPYWPAKPLLCEDNWFAFQIYRFGGLHDFEMELHHAYGDNCTFCNDPLDERYDGITGSATFNINEDIGWEYAPAQSSGTETSWTLNPITMDIAFDHGRTFYD